MTTTTTTPTRFATFAMLNPTLTDSTCTADGVTRRYVRYTMPAFISNALGQGCVCRTLSVTEDMPAPVLVAIQFEGSRWIAVASGNYTADECARIGERHARDFAGRFGTVEAAVAYTVAQQ